jgi:hypothetical protein
LNFVWSWVADVEGRTWADVVEENIRAEEGRGNRGVE